MLLPLLLVSQSYPMPLLVCNLSIAFYSQRVVSSVDQRSLRGWVPWRLGLRGWVPGRSLQHNTVQCCATCSGCNSILLECQRRRSTMRRQRSHPRSTHSKGIHPVSVTHLLVAELYSPKSKLQFAYDGCSAILTIKLLFPNNNTTERID